MSVRDNESAAFDGLMSDLQKTSPDEAATLARSVGITPRKKHLNSEELAQLARKAALRSERG